MKKYFQLSAAAIAILLLILFFNKLTKKDSLFSKIQYVQGDCVIFGKNEKAIREYQYEHCAFLDDGSMFGANDNKLSYLDKNGSERWSINQRFHHGIELDEKQENILAIISDVIHYDNKRVRTDIFLKIDLSGKIVAKWKVSRHLDILKKLIFPRPISLYKSKWFIPHRDTRGELTHANSFFEIPTNSSPIPAFKKGNFLVNLGRGFTGFLILSSDLKSILWFNSVTSFQHDARILENGNILFYNNLVLDADGKYHDEAQEYDPVNKLMKRSIALTAPELISDSVDGSVQFIGDDSLLYTHSPTPKEEQTSFIKIQDKLGNVVWSVSSSSRRIIKMAYFRTRMRNLSGFLKNSTF